MVTGTLGLSQKGEVFDFWLTYMVNTPLADVTVEGVDVLAVPPEAAVYHWRVFPEVAEAI